MQPHMEDPATLAACGAPNSDLAGASICSESTALHVQLQVSLLVRRVGLDAGTAATLAPMVFGVLS